MINKKLKTFCPLPWMHISADSKGLGRVCCNGFELLKDDKGHPIPWKSTTSLHSYFNSEDYKQIRKGMLEGKRPKHCFHCFREEDHGVKSIRQHFLEEYKSDIEELLSRTHTDGSIDEPKIFYIDMALGNKCNLKCRMCGPLSSYIIGKDWKGMGLPYDEKEVKSILHDKWYASLQTLQMIKQALPHIRLIFTTGGEPMLIKEHLDMLEMIRDEGYAGHIDLQYNSNQTVIPDKIIDLWKHFKKVSFNCSVEAYGYLNDYIRHPSKWEHLKKNIYLLDRLACERNNMEVYIHTTFQAYNVMRIPELINYLRYADFKKVCRVPFFIWVKQPERLSPAIFPKKMRYEMADRILETVNEHKEFFLNYNKWHKPIAQKRISVLEEYCDMLKKDDSSEKYRDEFIRETKRYDAFRKESVLNVLPELKEYFV